jgi:hypothetical protein
LFTSDTTPFDWTRLAHTEGMVSSVTCSATKLTINNTHITRSARNNKGSVYCIVRSVFAKCEHERDGGTGRCDNAGVGQDLLDVGWIIKCECC